MLHHLLLLQLLARHLVGGGELLLELAQQRPLALGAVLGHRGRRLQRARRRVRVSSPRRHQARGAPLRRRGLRQPPRRNPPLSLRTRGYTNTARANGRCRARPALLRAGSVKAHARVPEPRCRGAHRDEYELSLWLRRHAVRPTRWVDKPRSVPARERIPRFSARQPRGEHRLRADQRLPPGALRTITEIDQPLRVCSRLAGRPPSW